MRNFKFCLFLIVFVLCSCSTKKLNSSSIFSTENGHQTQHDYREIQKQKVSWNSVFFLAEPQYFVYFYSPICSHCNEIKNDIIEYGLMNENFYFCESDENHKIAEDVQNTVGAKSIENFWICGYPSLCKFDKNVCTMNVSGSASIYLVLNL